MDYYRYDARYVLGRDHSGRRNASFWGWICGEFPGTLVPIERRLNAEQYVRILDDALICTVTAAFGDDEVLNILEDNSPVHTAHIVTEWFDANPRFNRLPLPPRSPDINIIENVWAEMVREWTPTMAPTAEQMHARVNEAWENLRDRQNFFNTLADSVPRRLQKIINVQGAHINY